MYILVEYDMLSVTTCTSRLNAVKRRRKIYDCMHQKYCQRTETHSQ